MVKKYFWLFIFSVGMTGTPVQLAAQNTDPPNTIEKVISVVNEVKLGLQVRGGVRGARQEMVPLTTRSLEYLQRPVSGTLSYSVRYYGAGLALRFRGAEVAAAFRQGGEIGASTHWLQFRDGTDAVPFTPSFGRTTLRAEYLAFGWVGVGVAVHWSSGTLSCRSACTDRVDGGEQSERAGTEGEYYYQFKP